MWYWIVMGLLIATAVGLMAAIFISMKKNKRAEMKAELRKSERKSHKEEPERPKKVKRVKREEPEEIYEDERPYKPAKKQWKILLENLETWEKYTYVFYDNIGIGRSREAESFEKFLTIREDSRVSKVHCVIVRKGDKLYLRDMNSRNGTFLNGTRVNQPVILQRDDIIGVGETKIEVRKVLRERD